MKPSNSPSEKMWDFDLGIPRPALDTVALRSALLCEREAALAAFLGHSRNDPGSPEAICAGETAAPIPLQLCSREAYRLSGCLFEGPVARDMLLRIQEHKWLTAEREGRDIWTETDPTRGWQIAANDWMTRYFLDWMAYWKQGAPCSGAC